VYTVSLAISADSCNSKIIFDLDTNDPFHFFRPDGGVLGLAGGATKTTEVPALEQLKAFPNPAANEMTVAFNSLKTQEVEMVLSNLSGQAIYRQVINATSGANALRVQVQSLTPGLYLLQLRTSDQVQTVKVIKG
jgi:hypothetical protein